MSKTRRNTPGGGRGAQGPWQRTADAIQNLLMPKHQNATPAQQREALGQRIVADQLTEMCMSRFKWTGLPESVSERWLEWLLISQGSALVGIDPRNRFPVLLQPVPLSMPNYQNEVSAFRGIASNYPGAEFTTMERALTVDGKVKFEPADAAVVYNNSTRTPSLHVIEYYANRLAELDRTMDINSLNLRQARIIAAGVDEELAMGNMVNQFGEGTPYIQVRNLEMAMNITTLDLGTHPDFVDKLHLFRTRLFNEAMTVLGIDNSNQDKRERLVTDEVGGNDDQIARVRSSMLNARRKAAAEISAIIGTPVDVDYFVEDDPSNDPMEERQVPDGDVHAQVE